MTTVPDPTLEEVAPGIFAYLQLHGQWGLNNAGFILDDKATTVIDTCFTEKRSRAFAEADAITKLQVVQVHASPRST